MPLMVLLGWSLLPVTLGAQDPNRLDPSVSAVLTGGYWTSAKAAGRFRVIVTSEGWEHVGSEVTIQWLQEDSTSRGLIIARSTRVDQITAGIFSIGQPTMRCIDTGCTFHLVGTDSRSLERRSWDIKMAEPGNYVVISNPK
jgi:hypothetical protein